MTRFAIARVLGAVAFACIASDSAIGQEVVCYEYDELGRLKSATYQDGSQLVYSYDTQGNRTQLNQSTTGTASCAAPTVPASFPGEALGNNPPVANADSASVSTGGSVVVSVLANDTDPDGNNLSVSQVTQPTSGSATISGGGTTVTFTASQSAGSYPFTYTASDGNGGTASATVTVTVSGSSNTPPVANYDSASTSTNSTIMINAIANDTDADGDPLTITSVTQPASGSAAIVGNQIQFTASGVADIYVISYTISDGNGGTSSNNIAVSVTGGGGGFF